MTTKLRPEFCLEEHLELLRKLEWANNHIAANELHDLFPITLEEAEAIVQYYRGAETE